MHRGESPETREHKAMGIPTDICIVSVLSTWRDQRVMSSFKCRRGVFGEMAMRVEHAGSNKDDAKLSWGCGRGMFF